MSKAIFNPLDLTDRNVVVTGASSGLGRATAILLAQLGARVLATGRDVGRLQETRDALHGTGHVAATFDLGEADSAAEWLAEQAQSFGPLHGLVHAAGTRQLKPLQVSRRQDFEQAFRINVAAGAELLRGLSRAGVAAAGGASAVFIGSVLSCVGAAGAAAYAAAKAALLGLVRSAALELARRRIRVNAVLPGYFRSPMTARAEQHLAAEQNEQIARLHPLGIGRVEDVAAAVAFLLSDAAGWITGSCLTVDGGYTAQ
jgi:NAD(P)-dependent dehydrogenase (short-subunit alcohol dehydrogenase family)